MSDRKRKEEEAIAKFTAGYMQLVTLALPAVRENRKADEVADVVDDMEESMAKGMLVTRIVTDAMAVHQHAQQQAASDDVTLH